MSSMVPEQYGEIGPWQRYVEREHTARAAYLHTVQHAHHEYLLGPWPDRQSYQHVEQSAWVTYYAAGREAWRIYRQELAPPPPPPGHAAAADLTRDAAGEVWPADPPRSERPSFNPYPERMS